jgi:glucosamine-6-phosphate deaminase
MGQECQLITRKVSTQQQGQALAAELFMKASNTAPQSPVGLATGGTMSGVYQQLVASGFKPRFAHAFALDEYHGISPTSKNSYFNELTNKFVEPLLWQGQLHVPGQGKYATESGNSDFESDLRGLGPVSVQLLGIGVNGHIAFNEPGSDFESRTRRVELHEETIRSNAIYFDDLATVPTHANTQGLATIGQAKLLLLLVFGEHKKQALLKSIQSPDQTTPLAALMGHKNLVLVTDLAI